MRFAGWAPSPFNRDRKLTEADLVDARPCKKLKLVLIIIMFDSKLVASSSPNKLAVSQLIYKLQQEGSGLRRNSGSSFAKQAFEASRFIRQD